MGAVSVANGVVLYFDSSTSGIGDYEVISTYPDTNIEKDEYTSVTNQTLEFAQYSTILSLGRTLIDAGLWEFGLYTYVDVNSGTSSLIASVYSRTSGGTESLLFNVESHPITNTVVGLNITDIVQPQFIINSSDLLVVKISAKTTSLTPVNVHFVHSGNVNYSHIKTPLITLHNTVAGLQGGNLTERYHLSLSEYNGTGTGVMVRQSSPTITGAITAGSFIMSGGTSSQYLMSDGSVSNIIDVSGKANIVSPTFTGTVILPTTTSIGNVSSTELSYIDGVTSGIQAQLNTKITANTSTNNYVPKVSGTNTFANSRIIDTGTYLGIGSVNTPTKDITFGNQSGRVIGIEDSMSDYEGRDLSLSGGRTLNYALNSAFNTLSQYLNRSLSDMCVAPNGDMYVMIDYAGNDIIVRYNGTTDFVSSYAGYENWQSICSLSDNTILAITNGGNLYKRAVGVGTWSNLGNIGLGSIQNMRSDSNNNVYITTGGVYNFGYIYKQTNATGAWNQITADNRPWEGLAIKGTDIYASAGSTIYKQTGGSGSFIAIPGSYPRSRRMLITASNNLYFATNNSWYFQSNMTGAITTNSSLGYYGGIVETANTNIYMTNTVDGILMQQNDASGIANLKGGDLNLSTGTGKGTGSNDINLYTGQKTVSGTNMQVKTLRMKINNEGLVTLPSVTNALITTDVTGKAVITKEYVDVSQITITTTASITTGTTASNGFGQKGKNVIIDNGSNAINITVDGGTDFVSSYVKHGSGVITFVQGSGRSLIQVDATAILNGATGSTATIASIGTTDYLRISNA